MKILKCLVVVIGSLLGLSIFLNSSRATTIMAMDLVDVTTHCGDYSVIFDGVVTDAEPTTTSLGVGTWYTLKGDFIKSPDEKVWKGRFQKKNGESEIKVKMIGAPGKATSFIVPLQKGLKGIFFLNAPHPTSGFSSFCGATRSQGFYEVKEGIVDVGPMNAKLLPKLKVKNGMIKEAQKGPADPKAMRMEAVSKALSKAQADPKNLPKKEFIELINGIRAGDYEKVEKNE